MAESSQRQPHDDDDDDPKIGPSSSSTSASTSSSKPLHLTIRFSTSLPDLPITISSPSTTTILSLKRRVRTLRPSETHDRHLRFIHAGKVLPDTATLDHALRISLPPPPPRNTNSTTGYNNDHENDNKGKGKGKSKAPAAHDENQTIIPIYIHCSIGHVLTSAELAREAVVDTTTTQHDDDDQQQQQRQQQNTAAPRGFDRLLGAGFTQQEIAALRAQFLQLQSYTHTPDTMPTATELRLLEDRWIDDSAAGSGAAGMVGGGGGVGDGWGEMGGAGVGPGSGLDDMLIGNVLGFFWPLGAVVWLLREEGVWSSRRQMAVFTGILVNFAFSVMRVTG